MSFIFSSFDCTLSPKVQWTLSSSYISIYYSAKFYSEHHQDRKRIKYSAAPSPPPTPKKLNRKGSMTPPPSSHHAPSPRSNLFLYARHLYSSSTFSHPRFDTSTPKFSNNK
ncbi:hypothetical protein Rs2_15782 [Raphanus sativus]|nr:hypothetical protein Rs2_15782 [Raphanus sativus]